MKNKFRAIISGLLYIIALVLFVEAIIVTSGGSFFDLSDLARLILCGLAIFCVILATIIWKSKKVRSNRTKVIVMLVAIVVIIAGGVIDTFFTQGQKTVEYASIRFPFKVSDVENIEAYHYYSDPSEAEKKIIEDSETMTYLYDKLDSLKLQEKNIEDQATHNVAIFRFNLIDGTEYDIVYVGYGVKNGEIQTSDGSNYFTSADIGGICINLPGEAVSVDENELSEVNIIPSTKPIVTEDKLIYGETDFNDISLDREDIVIEQVGVLTEPSELAVVCNGKQITALRGTYSWMHQNEDGTATSIEADSMHPLESKEYMPDLPLEYSYKSSVDSFRAYLEFLADPDEVEVAYWSEECWNNTSADKKILPVKTVEIDFADDSWGVDYAIDLFDGNYIYEVVARWNSSEKYSGVAHYSFYTTMGSYEQSHIGE